MRSTSMKTLSWIMLVMFVSGCSSTEYAKNFNGMPTADGKPIAHLSTSNVALHFLISKQPLAGNASLEQTVSDFTTAAKDLGASKVNIVQSSKKAWWFIFFPFSILVTPVTSNVAGDAIQ